MFDPYADAQRKKLLSSVKGSRDAMRPFYEKAAESFREMVGKHYSDKGTSVARPLNMIELAVTIYMQNLVASAPQVNITASDRALRADAASLKLAINKHLAKSSLQEEMECWVLEAMMTPMGIIKLSLDMEDVQEIDGMQVVGGLPKATAILHDDWVQDMRAKSPWAVSYCGDRYSISKAFAEQHFDPDIVKKIPKENSNREDYDSSKLSAGSEWEDDSYREMITVWDLWLPYEGLIVTVTGDFDYAVPPLNVVEWTGPARGPFHRLFFGQVPGNSMPLPPVALWKDLNRIINLTGNKLIDQIERMKKNTLIDSQDKELGDLLRDARDGEGIVAQNLQGVKEIVLGGLDQPSFGALLQFKQLFAYMGGNLDALGGLAAMSGTVGQDKLLNEGASQRIKQMQGKMYVATQRLCEDIAEYFWSDPTLSMPISKPIPGTGDTIETEWNREQMQGSPQDYGLVVEPYSLQKRSPRERLAQVQEFWDRMIQSLPIYQAMGMMPNAEALHKLYIELAELPELGDLVTYTQGEQMPQNNRQRMPSSTKRTYERVNRGSATQAGQEQRMIQNMMGGGDGGMQASEAAISMPQ